MICKLSFDPSRCETGRIFLVHSLKFHIFVCGLFIRYFSIFFVRLVVKQGDFFLLIKPNLSDKYLHMSDIIATFVA